MTLLRDTGSPSTGRRHDWLHDALLPHARRHVRDLGRGLAFSGVLVGARLALPLPLTAVVATATGSGPGLPVPVLSAGFVGLAVLAGLAEHHQRLAFAHFVGRTVSDARAEALTASTDAAGVDLTTQVLGDCLRVKSGLKGLLNHITVNGMLVIGVCVALLLTDPVLALVTGIGSALLLVVAAGGARRIGRMAVEHRRREVQLAGAVHRLAAGSVPDQNGTPLAMLRRTDAQSGAADVAITQWEGLTTWLATVVFAVTAGTVVLIGGTAVHEGRLTLPTLVAVTAYLLVLQGPSIRCVRQLTRTASLLVSARELGTVVLGSRTTGG